MLMLVLVCRCSAAYSIKVQKTKDTKTLLRCWYTWREHTKFEQRLKHKAQQADRWYTEHHLKHRVFDSWYARARCNYKLILAKKHEQHMTNARQDMASTHAAELGVLR